MEFFARYLIFFLGLDVFLRYLDARFFVLHRSLMFTLSFQSLLREEVKPLVHHVLQHLWVNTLGGEVLRHFLGKIHSFCWHRSFSWHYSFFAFRLHRLERTLCALTVIVDAAVSGPLPISGRGHGHCFAWFDISAHFGVLVELDVVQRIMSIKYRLYHHVLLIIVRCSVFLICGGGGLYAIVGERNVRRVQVGKTRHGADGSLGAPLMVEIVEQIDSLQDARKRPRISLLLLFSRRLNCHRLLVS